MSYRPHGRARVDARNPAAFGVCDRDGLLYNLSDLVWQYDFRGNQLQNLWIRVCKKCLDVPQNQLRPKAMPADPVPVYQPRPENYAAANAGGSPAATSTVPNVLTNSQGDVIVTENTVLIVADH